MSWARDSTIAPVDTKRIPTSVPGVLLILWYGTSFGSLSAQSGARGSQNSSADPVPNKGYFFYLPAPFAHPDASNDDVLAPSSSAAMATRVFTLSPWSLGLGCLWLSWLTLLWSRYLGFLVSFVLESLRASGTTTMLDSRSVNAPCWRVDAREIDAPVEQEAPVSTHPPSQQEPNIPNAGPRSGAMGWSS